MSTYDSHDFTRDQWRFLAAAKAIGQPISIDIIGELAPLKPGEVLDLVRKGNRWNLIRQDRHDRISLGIDLPEWVNRRLEKINSPHQLNADLKRLEDSRLIDRIPPGALANLLACAGQKESSARLYNKIAIEARGSGKLEEAFGYLSKCLDQISSSAASNSNDTLHVSAALAFYDLHLMLGRAFSRLMSVLDTAGLAADRLGDTRSQSLIHLSAGMLLWLSGSTPKAMKRLKAGKRLVDELGDYDIVSRAATYLGAYYYIQGKLKRAVEYFELATRESETDEGPWLVHPLAPIGLSTCLSYQNQFYHAIGHLEYHWLRAKNQNLDSLATIFRAGLGIMLVRVDQKSRAMDHLNAALKEAEAQQNLYALFLARSGLTLYLFKMDRYDEAREMLNSILVEPSEQPAAYVYITAMQLEMLSMLEQLGKKPIPGYECRKLLQELTKDPSLHLRGSALRLKAERTPLSDVSRTRIFGDLQSSLQLLKESGDQYELAKTQAVLAKLKLDQGSVDEARSLANEARKGLTGHGERYFPHSLRVLIEPTDHGTVDPGDFTGFQEQIIATIENASIPLNIEEGFSSVMSSLNRFLGAERGGLFRFEGEDKPTPVLKTAYNLSRHDIELNSFRSSRSAVLKCFRQNRPLKIRNYSEKRDFDGNRVSSLICLPLTVKNEPYGVLYYDNSYNHDCFTHIPERSLKWMAAQLSLFLELAQRVNHSVEEAKKSLFEQSAGQRGYEAEKIVYQSDEMADLLSKTDRIAGSESSVLILGETGVGKELLARRLHEKGRRRTGPFITFSPGSVPENLVESELFGHEKGAFTGADRSRHGLVELADGGTLFIDEVGEFPKNIQVKLLRVLQEKTFRRIGANRVRTSDFRLIAATNRDMVEEVASGRFREDLYYRLNTIPLEMPPLRERREDIVALAQHFLETHPGKHGRSQPRLTSRHKSILREYHWPGNVRELKNVMEQAVILSMDGELELTLPARPKPPSMHPFDDIPSLDEVQRRYIKFVLEKTNGRLSGPGGAATLLGVKRTTLHNRMKKLGIK
ncbi:MAG: AAA domain-containing protein [Proteobacteria bacterium]|nr:AAA domain-containing protein [Pseudomonadota bacterium]